MSDTSVVVSAAPFDSPITEASAGVSSGAAGSQTVTLVLTDVEGSTRLWTDHASLMDTVMARHHEIVRAAVAAHGGWRPVDQGEGDAVFAVFDSPTAAIAAVTRFQQQLAAESWPAGIEIRVRVGVHIGEVTVRDSNLFGSTVNRCARLRGLGAGGQVLLSAPVWELVRDRLPDGVRVVDLGEHRMKDLTRAEHVHQLMIPGLPAEFPPLASLDRARHNLPVQASSFLGRDAEVARLTALLDRERLVTVLGFGGMGKTRLALQVAAELATGDGDGVWLVDLSAVTDPAQLPGLVNATVGVAETPAGPLPALLAGLATRRLLLVLDNLEQLLPDAARTVAQIAAAGPDLRVLVTSREPLRLRGEHVFPLAPLPVPPPPRPPLTDAEVGRLSTYTAVTLFLARAAAAAPDFGLTAQNAAAVAAICARLDGLPLAIELAASRTRLLAPDAILTRLDNALKVLVGGSRDLPTRHQTLRATIAWSYDALDPDQQQLLDRLSVFPGTFTLDAAESVCGPALLGDDDLDVLDGLGLLVDRSLVRVHPATEAQSENRYSLLVSIRDYANQQLAAAGHTASLADRHAAHYAAATTYPPDFSRDDRERIDRLRIAELHHLRAALIQARTAGTLDQQLALARNTGGALEGAGQGGELRTVLEYAVAGADAATPDLVRLLTQGASTAWQAWDWDRARQWSERAVEAARAVGDSSLLVNALGVSLITARTLDEDAGIRDEVDALLAELPTKVSIHLPEWSVIEGWDNAVIFSPFSKPEAAEAAARRRLRDAPPPNRAIAGAVLALWLMRTGRLEDAEPLLAPFETPDGPPETSGVDKALGILNAVEMRLGLGDVAAAKRDLQVADQRLQTVDRPELARGIAQQRAAVERLEGDHPAAAYRLETLAADPAVSSSDLAWTRRLLAVVRREQGDHDAAVALLSQAHAYAVEAGQNEIDLALLCLLERAAQLTDDRPADAVRLLCLVTTRRPHGGFIDALVRYDTDAMLTDLRARLGTAEVDRILTAAATEDLPDSLP